MEDYLERVKIVVLKNDYNIYMITITTRAKQQINKLIENGGKSALLYLKGGGCNGFSYKFKILEKDEKPDKLDDIIKVNQHNLYLCNKSTMFLIGTKVDYVEDIMGSRFDFENQNIKSKCGCGTSFNFDLK